MLQGGERLSEAFSREKVLPAEYIRTFRVAEAAGEMDAELTLLATRSEELAVAALNKWSRILPGMVYAMAVCYVGYVVFMFYKGQVSEATDMLNQFQ
jgi:type II secretory pathway component PulF